MNSRATRRDSRAERGSLLPLEMNACLPGCVWNATLDKAVKQNYTDSILLALPIVSINPAGGPSVVIDLADIFFTDFAQLPFGTPDRGRTSWHKIKGFPNNLELEV